MVILCGCFPVIPKLLVRLFRGPPSSTNPPSYAPDATPKILTPSSPYSFLSMNRQKPGSNRDGASRSDINSRGGTRLSTILSSNMGGSDFRRLDSRETDVEKAPQKPADGLEVSKLERLDTEEGGSRGGGLYRVEIKRGL